MSSNMRPNWYERHVLPYLLDFACGIRPVWRQRHKVVPLAEGRVLEIGIGTGLNLEHYDKARIEKIVGLDPGLEMHRLAQKRAMRAALAVELVGLSAERIPYQDGSFDTVLVTYSLCTIPDPGAALKQMRRVLKPRGRLIFCEHGLAPDASVRRWQDRLTPLWSKLAGGCHLNRDIPGLLEEARFQSADMQSMYLPGPRPLTYNYWGTAVAV
jgi:ubiquinone/menaquinone biosynthesis C-methylase UbiE